MITEWNDKELLKDVDKIAADVAKQGAVWVMNDARKILMSKAKHPTGKLASEIEIKISKFNKTDYIVQAQGPGNYSKFYATFVELGTHKMDKIPYMRPALARNKAKIRKAYRNKLK